MNIEMDNSNLSDPSLHPVQGGRMIKLLTSNSATSQPVQFLQPQSSKPINFTNTNPTSHQSQFLQPQTSKSINLANANIGDWLEKDAMAYVRKQPAAAADNMTRWLQKAESETHFTTPQSISASGPQQIKQTANQVGDQFLLPVRVDNAAINVAKPETFNVKNKFMQGSQLALHLQKPTPTTSNITSELPVNLSNVILLSKSHSDNQPNMAGAASGSSFSASKQDVNYNVNPVYKSKLEKAVAQNQSVQSQNQSVQSQLLMSSLMTKAPPKTLKKLLSVGHSEPNSQQFDSQAGKNTFRSNNITNNTMGKTDIMDSNRNADIVHPNQEEALKYVQTFAEEVGRNIAEHERVIGAGVMHPIEYPAPLRKSPSAVGEIVQPSLQVDFDIQSNSAIQIEPNPSTVQISSSNATVSDFPYSSVNASIPQMVQLTTAQDIITNPTMRVFCVGEKLVEMTPMISGSLQTLDCGTGAMVPMMESGSGYQTRQEVIEKITEKDYEDPKVGQTMMEGMWKLREKDLFCDAILYVGQQEIKLHKLVLAAVSVEVYKKVECSQDTVIKLVLPADIKYENVSLFVSYIYTGKLKLTVDNVQHLYRLSAVFNIEELSKFCYDFCKLAKMGHLIIHSPYLEAAKQIKSPPPSTTAAKGKEKSESAPVSVDAPPSKLGPASNTSKQGPASNTSKQGPASKQATKKETKISDTSIDWMTSDPSQCNIPIRKRGRTRRGLNTTATPESGNQFSSPSVSEPITSISDGGRTRRGLNTTATPESGNQFSSPSVSESITSISDGGDASRQNTESFDNITISVSMKNSISDSFGEEIKSTENRIKPGPSGDAKEDHIPAIVSLPDPLASGKFDDSELINLAPLIDSEIASGFDYSPKVTPTKSMVTRYRGRPKSVSVLEAASNKKARNNDIGAGMTPGRTVKPRGKGKKTETSVTTPAVISPPRDTTAEVFDRLLETVDVQALHTDDFDKDESTAQKPQEESLKTGHDINSNGKKAESVKEREKAGEQRESPGENANEPLDSERATTSGKDAMEAPLPKKARLRKSTVEHHQELPLKDTVYMRPPPKKRTKEIREMMKNEADTIKEEKSVLKFEQLMKYAESKFREIEDVENMNKSGKKSKGKKRKVKPLEDAALMEKMYDIELSGQNLQGEKRYTCKLCSNEFVFVRRAITHLVGTHDIALEDTNEYITVDNKKFSTPKECDICGYKTKDSNAYYIHYHKYFRHNVPLPKGWQPYTCDLCKKEFFTKFQLREHKLIHFEDNPFVCEHCGSGYKSRTCLNSHVFHKHSSVKRHKCSECPKTFKTMTQMKVHKRTHTGEKPFGCPIDNCLYRSTTRGNMRLHLVNRHKFSGLFVKDLMTKLETNVGDGGEADAQVQGWIEDVENGEKFSISLQEKDKDIEMDADDRVLETLVEAAAAEVSAQMSSESVTRQETMNVGKFANASSAQEVDIHVLAQEEGLIVTEQGNDYGLGQNVHGNGMESNVTINGQTMVGQNIPRHVELLIQNCGVESQNDQNLMNQSQDHLLHAYQHNPAQQPIENVSTLHDLRQDESVSSPEYVQMESTKSMDLHLQGKPLILDPHSREARMIVNEALHGNSHGSMLKAVILQAHMDAPKQQTSHLRTFTDDHIMQTTQHYQGDGSSDANQQHTTQDHSMIHQENQVMSSMRSPIHDQFGGGNSNSLYRLDHSASQSLNLSNSSQHPNTVDSSQLQQTFQPSSVSPPAYNSSHGIISLPSSTMAASQPSMIADGQVHGQGRPGQQQVVRHGQQEYVMSDPSTSAAQYTADGQHEYQGYYQDSYDIENY